VKTVVSISRATFIAVAVLFISLNSTPGQTPEGLKETWRGPDLAMIRTILDDKSGDSESARAELSLVKFTPAGDSGVSKVLAEAFGRTPKEIAALRNAFDDIKKGYTAEVGKEGKSNNIAAALAFFIATNVMVFNDSPAPSDEATEAMFYKLQGMIARSPGFARVTNIQKQQMHDWLVCVAGFALTNYQHAKSTSDASGLRTIRDFAGYATQLVLGTELGATGPPPAAPDSRASAMDGRLVGVWSISASSPAGSTMSTSSGYAKGQYNFKPDGTYDYKSERWFGYARSREFYTTQENGTYVVNGNSLIVSPKSSKTVLRNPEGVIQKTQNNQLERVSYRWQLHYFEGLNETQLVLQPPAETNRDGGFSSSSLFPNAYLFSQGSKLEWRF
jgi:hypothetical protein